ncbi:hypothetical protein ACFUN7_01695 [Streptomyces sp. NPDC057236]
MPTGATATPSVTPLRQGGSVPGVFEADGLGTYVAGFTGFADLTRNRSAP